MTLNFPGLFASMLNPRGKWRREAGDWLVEAPEPLESPPARPARGGLRPPQLQETRAFGRNPGALRMLDYAPPGLGKDAALVVVLHGCQQTAEEFDRASGWSEMARREGFAVLYPEQNSGNNPNLCFNWFRPSAASHDRGEIMSIRQMIEVMRERHAISSRRIYVFGLSAGGAMAAMLLASYPELFDGGALFAGLPVGSARDAMGALGAMRSGVAREAGEWVELARRASPDAGRYPTISIWHGREDKVVSVVNAEALVQQWLGLHGVADAEVTETRSGQRQTRRWRDQSGRIAVEQHLVDGMDHGLPVSAARLGRVQDKSFFFDIGVCAATEMTRCWKLKGNP